MSQPKWLAALPAADAAVEAFPECVDGELDLHRLRVVGATVASAVVVDRPELVDVALLRCDVAGFVGRNGRAARVLVEDSRLRGVTWANGVVEDVLFERVTAADLSLRFSKLRRVVFRDCQLPELDLTEAGCDDVRFERCDLRAAKFHHARVGALRLEGCDLTGCTGAEALRGASVHGDDLMTLAPSLAAALDITVE